MAGAFNRRSFLRGASVAALAAVSGASLAGCASGGGAPMIRFSATKRETVEFWNNAVAEYNKMQSDWDVRRELSTNLVADFVRNTPVPVGVAGFDFKFGGFAARGVLADQSKNPALERITPEAIEFSQQFGTFGDEISSLPYSIAGQGVIFNRALFDQIGAEIPTTWSEFKDLCERFQAAGITPIMGTFVDTWTLDQGPFNYGVGGMIDVAEFFKKLNALGTETGPDAEVSFTKDFSEPLLRIRELLPYFNADAKNIGYDQGNRDMAAGKAAMLFQGPWAFAGIKSANPDFPGGIFPLPMTDDPSDTRVTANLDLTAFTPKSATGDAREGGLAFLDFIMQPDFMHNYNNETLAFSPDKDAPRQKDPFVSDLNDYMFDGKYVQGPGLYIPAAIPRQQYMQEFWYGGSVETFTGKLDRDWARLAIRLAA